MKAFLTAFLCVVFGISISAQNTERKETSNYLERPVLIINNAILGNTSALKRFTKEELSLVEVIKEGQLSETKLYSRNAEGRGILKVNADGEFDIKTQKVLNIFFGLPENSDVYVNKYLIDKEYSVLTESIQSIEIMKADGIELKAPSLNIEI